MTYYCFLSWSYFFFDYCRYINLVLVDFMFLFHKHILRGFDGNSIVNLIFLLFKLQITLFLLANKSNINHRLRSLKNRCNLLLWMVIVCGSDRMFRNYRPWRSRKWIGFLKGELTAICKLGRIKRCFQAFSFGSRNRWIKNSQLWIFYACLNSLSSFKISIVFELKEIL